MKIQIRAQQHDYSTNIPLDAINTGELAAQWEWNWLPSPLTPFPAEVIMLSVPAGTAILLIARLKSSTHRHTLLWTVGRIIAVTLLFWILLVVLAFRLISRLR